jgi:hypothetical protein
MKLEVYREATWSWQAGVSDEPALAGGGGMEIGEAAHNSMLARVDGSLDTDGR